LLDSLLQEMKPVIIWTSVTILGVVLVVGGVLTGWVIRPMVLHGKLDLNDENSEGFEYFVVPPVDVIMKFYFMEVTNGEDVLEGKAKPILSERGPYTFREGKEKKNLTRPSDQFLNFGQYINYTFVPELSCADCTRDDEVTILNMPLIGLVGTFIDKGLAGGTGIDKLNEKLEDGTIKQDDAAVFFKAKVGEFLFDGISNSLVDWVSSYGLTKNRLPPVFKDGKFALFNGKVNTAENECYQVETGAESWDRHTMITKYGRDLNSLEDSLAKMKTLSTTGTSLGFWWSGKDSYGNGGNMTSCNQIKGTDGQQFPPGVNKKEKLWIFNTAPCRSIYLDFQQDSKVEGINTYRYVVPLDGANVNKTDNFCACLELSDCVECNSNVTENCFRRSEEDPDTLDISRCNVENCHDGLQDISVCQGAPTFLSFPHFYLSPDQQDKFEGLEPDLAQHETYLNVEPNTGMTVKLHSRIQINTPLMSQDDLFGHTLDVLKQVKAVTAFPILWLDQGADIEDDPDMVEHLKSQLLLVKVADILKWVLIGLGIAATLGGGGATFASCCGK